MQQRQQQTAFRWRKIRSGSIRFVCCGAKGTRTPPLTRKNAVLAAVSFRPVPSQSRSSPAVSFSGLDGVKSTSSRTWTRDGPHVKWPGIGMLGATAIARTALDLQASTRCSWLIAPMEAGVLQVVPRT
jgi:hypothetical protein